MTPYDKQWTRSARAVQHLRRFAGRFAGQRFAVQKDSRDETDSRDDGFAG